MAKVRFVLAFFVAFALFGGLIRPATPALAADPESVGFVSGQWRVVVHQVALIDQDTALGLAKGTSGWVVAVADVTNVGVSVAPFGLADVTISADGDALEFSDTSTLAVHKKLKYAEADASGSIGLAEDETQRVALVFEAAADVDVADLSVSLDEQGVALELVAEDKIDSAALPAASKWSVSQTVVANAEIAAVMLPPSDECYGAETAQAVQQLTGGSVWVEGSGELVWYWDASQGHLVPLQASLVSDGFADALITEGSVFTPWLKSLADTAKDDDAGLWNVCKDAKGTWINPPTPAPPTAEELRADYTWVDIRDLAIRPHTFEGEKIAFEGEVFTVSAEEGFTGLQVWVNTPTGDREPVVVGYFGDLVGVYEGTWVTVYGTGAGTFEGTNGFGAAITQPMVVADIIDY